MVQDKKLRVDQSLPTCTKFHGNPSTNCHDIHFYSEQKMSACWNYKKSQEITKVNTIHPQWIMNICTKFHDSPSNSC